LGGLTEHQVGRRVASPLVTAYSDPALPGFGHYRYDHEGTPARRVVHIDRGIFRGFMNSRQTAAIFGGEPNGHWKATDASLVPLIRMSNTVFDVGTRSAEDIVKEVDHGYYVAGHRTPSIAESRENFRISARGVYEIKNGELKGLLDRGTKADIIDVRHWEAYAESHIQGARSMPLRVVADRAAEISKTGLVVFY